MRLTIVSLAISLFAAGCMLESSGDADHALSGVHLIADEHGLVHPSPLTGEEPAGTPMRQDQDYGAMSACPPVQWGQNFTCDDGDDWEQWVAVGCCSQTEVLEESVYHQTCYHNDSSASCVRTLRSFSRCRNVSPFTC